MTWVEGIVFAALAVAEKLRIVKRRKRASESKKALEEARKRERESE